MKFNVPPVTRILLTVMIAAPALTSPAFAQTSSEQRAAVRGYVRTSLNYLRENSEERQYHLPPDFTVEKAGNEVAIEYAVKDGVRKTYLNTKLNTFVDLGRSLSWADDRQNLVKAYTHVYSRLPAQFREGLTLPRKLLTASLPQVRKSYQALAQRIHLDFPLIVETLDPAIPDFMGLNPIEECSQEVGYENIGSAGELSERCAVGDYYSNGLFANLDFPLKDKLTCIKDQGNRGTCTSQAVAAAIETAAIVDGQARKNLSEQYIYYRNETAGDAQISVFQMQNYGSAIEVALDAFVSRGFGVFYESSWNYGRSLFGGDLTPEPSTGLFVHPDSCIGYLGEDCSDYVWQTNANVYYYALPEPENPPAVAGGAVHRITSNSYLPGIGSGIGSRFSLEQAVVLVGAGVPVILSMDITDNFSGANSASYIREVPNDPVRGGHTMLMVGFVPNAQLPSGIIPATSEGYFIIKNSWGIDAGDCGFYYLDFEYVRRRMYYLNVITIS